MQARDNTQAERKKVNAETAARPRAPTVMRPAPLEFPLLPEPLELEGADAETVAAGGAVAMALTPPVTGPLSVSVCSLLPICLAAAVNASSVLLPVVGALIAPTIPIPQCRICLQWNQIGCESSSIVIENCLFVWRPESKPVPLPLVKCVHGLWNEDCVTE